MSEAMSQNGHDLFVIYGFSNCSRGFADGLADKRFELGQPLVLCYRNEDGRRLAPLVHGHRLLTDKVEVAIEVALEI